MADRRLGVPLADPVLIRVSAAFSKLMKERLDDLR